jgi:two-component system cell cycle response regulator CtrA
MDEPEEKIIDVFMCKIRRKLQDILGPVGREYIETIWGRGYVLREPNKQNQSPSNVISVHPSITSISPFSKNIPNT